MKLGRFTLKFHKHRWHKRVRYHTRNSTWWTWGKVSIEKVWKVQTRKLAID